MSKVSKTQQDSLTAEFVSITGSTTKDAQSYLKKAAWRLEVAMDAYYNNPPPTTAGSSSKVADPQKISALFDKYKEPDEADIGIDGTIKLCKDLGVEPEDVVMLAVAYELKSPRVGEWTKEGWTEGWKKLNCDSIVQMRAAVGELSTKLSNDTDYFRSVYNYTFDFAKTETGQRSISIENACAFWGLLLPAGLKGRALQHMDAKTDGEEVVYTPSREPGWKQEYNDLWFEYLNEKGGKGVSKDTWLMFFDFVRTIDDKFEKHDVEAAWPSAIDDFAVWVKSRIE
ncbi:Scaffold-type E3 ligase [Serendipita sp. 401]|nr:Scaffold-type E3 ligase [Serendipita sp. 401]